MKDILKLEFYQITRDKKNLFILIASLIISSVLLLDSDRSFISNSLQYVSYFYSCECVYLFIYW